MRRIAAPALAGEEVAEAMVGPLQDGRSCALGLPARLVAGFTYRAPDQWPGGQYPNAAFAFPAWAEIQVVEPRKQALSALTRWEGVAARDGGTQGR